MVLRFLKYLYSYLTSDSGSACRLLVQADEKWSYRDEQHTDCSTTDHIQSV